MAQSSAAPPRRSQGDLSGKITGFYAVLDRDDARLAELLVDADRGGARVLQVRIKDASTRDLMAAARMARAVTQRFGALLVVNDRVDVALAVGADAVHLGQDDLPLAAARRLVGDRLWIGISTHDESQVMAAVAGGADYLGYGPVYPPTSKLARAPIQGAAALARAVAVAAGRPVVGIGGITPDRAEAVFRAGAAAACAIAAINHAPDPVVAASAIGKWWKTQGLL